MKYFLPSILGLVLLLLAAAMEYEDHQELAACSFSESSQCWQGLEPSSIILGIVLLLGTIFVQFVVSSCYCFGNAQTQARIHKVWRFAYPVIVMIGLYTIYS